MLFERIISEGLAHYSYLIGDGETAMVIDPRLDCEVYVAKASQAGMRIAYVFETHRNEDYVVGSAELAARTGAQVWHADAEMAYEYGAPAADGQSWEIGGYRLEAMATPGHTPGSIALYLDTPDGRVLFGQDVHGPFLPEFDSNIEQWRLSMEKLLALEADILCEGHYGVYRGKEEVARYIRSQLTANS